MFPAFLSVWIQWPEVDRMIELEILTAVLRTMVINARINVNYLSWRKRKENNSVYNLAFFPNNAYFETSITTYIVHET